MRSNLKKARVHAGLTQSDIAEHMGISLRQYQRIEAGDSNGSVRHWDALEDLLGVHQRILRENEDTHPCKEESLLGHSSSQR